MCIKRCVSFLFAIFIGFVSFIEAVTQNPEMTEQSNSLPLLKVVPPKISWFNDPLFQQQLDTLTNSTSSSTNEIALLTTGLSSFKQRHSNIASADAIFLKTYEFFDDETGKQVISWLLDQSKQGSQIFVQFDVKGFFDNYQDLKDIYEGTKSPIPPHLQNLLDHSNGNVYIIPTNTPTSYLEAIPGLRLPKDHEKYLITWQYKNQKGPVVTIMGGTNIGDAYAFGGQQKTQEAPKSVPQFIAKKNTGVRALAFHDIDIQVVGPVNRDIIQKYIKTAEYHLHNKNIYFEKNLKESVGKAIEKMKQIQDQMNIDAVTSFPNQGDAYARFVTNPTHTSNASERYINPLMIGMLNQIPSGETVSITSPAFLPTKEIQQSIEEASLRGVKFHFLLNKPPLADDDLSLIALAARCRYRSILSQFNNIFFYDWKGNPDNGIGNIIHAKVFCFGQGVEAPFAIGSYNLDSQSIRWNSEGILLIQSPKVKQQLQDQLQLDFSPPRATPVTLEELNSEGFTEKFQECMAELIFFHLL